LWLDFENGDVLILSFTMNCEVYCYYIVLVKCNLFRNSSGNLVSVDVKLPKYSLLGLHLGNEMRKMKTASMHN
jgi:hypothetical protein